MELLFHTRFFTLVHIRGVWSYKGFCYILCILDKRTTLLGRGFPMLSQGRVWLSQSSCFSFFCYVCKFFLPAGDVNLVNFLDDARQSVLGEMPLHFMFLTLKFISTFKIWQNYRRTRHHGTSGRMRNHSPNQTAIGAGWSAPQCEEAMCKSRGQAIRLLVIDSVPWFGIRGPDKWAWALRAGLWLALNWLPSRWARELEVLYFCIV